MGPHALLIEALDADPADWAAGLRELALPGIIDVVPAAETVLVACSGAAALSAVRERLGSVRAVDASDGPPGLPVVIPVQYDGEDLDIVADTVGLSVEELIARHCAPEYVVAFCGFTPGFGYLRGLDAALHLPRRATPRTRVPAGSVAIAAEYSAVYPRPSPGGWHLLGITDRVTFDPDRSPPALFQPGARVRFVAT
jgi:KipI family sensor histidine kinase inhibitor